MKPIINPIANVTLHDGDIGISLSGGADSAILAYILMSNHPGMTYFYTLANIEKGCRNAFHATMVLNKLVELTGNTRVKHIINYAQQQTRETLFSIAEKAVKDHSLVMFYMATTSTPPKDVLETFKKTMDEDTFKRRRKEIYKGHYNKDKTIYDPFMNIDKLQIKQLYQHYGVLDSIFPLTRSCESKTILDTHCGECWWCEERQWAFDKA